MPTLARLKDYIFSAYILATRSGRNTPIHASPHNILPLQSNTFRIINGSARSVKLRC
jgi:hypothetical protein